VYIISSKEIILTGNVRRRHFAFSATTILPVVPGCYVLTVFLNDVVALFSFFQQLQFLCAHIETMYEPMICCMISVSWMWMRGGRYVFVQGCGCLGSARGRCVYHSSVDWSCTSQWSSIDQCWLCSRAGWIRLRGPTALSFCLPLSFLSVSVPACEPVRY